MHPLIILAVATYIHSNGQLTTGVAGPFPDLWECAEMLNINRHVQLENGETLYSTKAECKVFEDADHEYRYDETGNDVSSTYQII
jgi:hypothetical protein